MVTPQQGVKVLDFGLATLLERDDQADVTIAGAVIGHAGVDGAGTARGERVGPRADVFSFGVELTGGHRRRAVHRQIARRRHRCGAVRSAHAGEGGDPSIQLAVAP